MNGTLGEVEKKFLQVEVEALSLLNHPNITNILRYGEAEYVKTSDKTKQVYYIVEELASAGELFDFIIDKSFSEEESRYYFN
mgnify:CR=1 FL=1